MVGRSSTSEAAVLIILSRDVDAECGSGDDRILLTKRASHLREHAGEVAFPGGKRDPEDKDLYLTALRECAEEVGVPASQLHYIDQLPAHQTRNGSQVAPFVVRADKPLDLVLNDDEIDSAFWVPASLFIEDKRSHTHVFKTAFGEYWAPVYYYQGYEVWGFTARVLVSFVNQLYGSKLGRDHAYAPEQLY